MHLAIRFLGWLYDRDTTPTSLDQATIEIWLTTTGPAAADIRDFLDWAADRGHIQRMNVPPRPRRTGPATSETERIALLTRLLHDGTLERTDRVAGALLLLSASNSLASPR